MDKKTQYSAVLDATYCTSRVRRASYEADDDEICRFIKESFK